jgi:hypothetical protein
MLAEIAAANAAFAVIKVLWQTARSCTSSAHGSLITLTTRPRFRSLSPRKGGGSDLEEFMALERLGSKKKSCVSAWSTLGVRGCGLTGRSFKLQAARKRREDAEAAARERKRRAERLAQLTEYIALGMASVVLAGLIIYGIVLYMLHLR